MFDKLLFASILAVLMMAPLTTFAKVSPGFTQKGAASYYHDSLHGRKTASGQRYNKSALTAAHKTLPLGTVVRVTNLRRGTRVKVKINDRGPFVKGRVIDLSRAAAKKLGMVKRGVAKVKVEVLEVPRSAKRRH